MASGRGLSRRTFLRASAATAAAMAAGCASGTVRPRSSYAEGKSSKPFQPTWESLASQYQCPEWFRDAKFGIWAHWSAQCVPEQGDWYARHMYMQGTAHYEYHLKHYGHPAVFGFKDIDHIWQADAWEPERLIDTYRRAGAQYFVALANHHDNFDCYDSKYHVWNSVNIGPKRDIVGTWARAARAAGLKFGVSNHSSHAWHWFQVAYGYDAEGPLAGVRYDGVLQKPEGVGTWWNGVDPQQLYVGPAIVIPEGFTDPKKAISWHNAHDGYWFETTPNAAFAENWRLRTIDLIDKYQPDLLYFDDTELPLGDAGLAVAAHLYNSSLARHGSVQAVVNAKKLAPAHRAALVEDYERGFSPIIQPLPWQTDTCIGDWHYSRPLYERHGYKSAKQVARMLVDIVSKNGNLLLSIPVRGNGSIDELEEAFLANFTRWMDVCSEGIFASRPWKVYGEGPTQARGGMFAERRLAYTAADIRFTTRGDTLYAFVMDTPTGDISIKSLGSSSGLICEIRDVNLLGSDEPLHWQQRPDALVIAKPATFPAEAVNCFRVR